VDCTCSCDPCQNDDDCENCTHEGCDAEAENCVDCPMATRRMSRKNPKAQRRAFEAMVAPETLDEEKRTVDVIWTTGASVLRGCWDRFWEELSLDPKAVRMARLQSGNAPLLNSHNSYDLDGVIGVVVSARLEPGRGVATVRFGRDPNSDAIFARVKDGILRNVSVGYLVHEYQSVEDVSGGSIPTKRATDWEPYEISVVPIGADAESIIRAASATNPENRMDPKKDPKVADPVNPAPAPAATPDEVRAAERDRGIEIRRITSGLGLELAVADEHISKDTSVANFRAIAIDLRAAQKHIPTGVGGDPTRIQAGEDKREKIMRGAGDWLLVRSGKADLVIAAAKKRGEVMKLEPGEFGGSRLLDLARECLDLRGVVWRGLSPTATFAAALSQRSVSGAAATGDFPILLENTLHKLLLAAYVVAPDTWKMFSKTGTAMDFRPHNRYRKGLLGRLDVVPENAEIKHKAIPDGEKEVITVETKANILAVTRQMLVNDDLGAFTDLASDLGMAAGLSIEEEVYELLLENGGLGPTMSDGDTLFHADHGNIGTGAAISAASLFADKVLMGRQKDPAKKRFLSLRPSILLVPDGLEGTAKSIVEARFDPDVSGKFEIPNLSLGVVSTIIPSPRLPNTRRYMLTDPSIAPVIEVDFLDGQQEPRMETRLGWEIDGAEWRIVFDFKANAIDFRGGITNAGV
jgi:hypothetical protein